jgi:archaellum component FlaC
MALNVRKISNDVYEKVSSYLCNFGNSEYQIPQSEFRRLASIYSQELGREIFPIEVQDASRKFKYVSGIPRPRGANFRIQLIDGQLMSRELSRRPQVRERGNNEERDSNVPSYLKPLERVINKQVKTKTKSLKTKLVEAKNKIKELEEKVKDLSSTCAAEAERFKRLVVEYDSKMAEMRYMMKIVEAVDEYTSFKRSTMKKKTYSIL